MDLKTRFYSQYISGIVYIMLSTYLYSIVDSLYFVLINSEKKTHRIDSALLGMWGKKIFINNIFTIMSNYCKSTQLSAV